MTLKRGIAPKTVRRRRSSAASQETKVARLTRELSEALKQQTATTEVLKVISRSAFDLQTVLKTLVESVGRLCDAERTIIFRPHDDAYRLVASYGYSEEFRELLAAESFKPGRDSVSGRTAAEKTIVHILDYQADPELRFQGPFEVPTHTILGVPLLREGALVGIMTLARSVVQPFNAKQIELATIFAAQAVIAIENTRLLSELRQRTANLTESLEQQTATSEVLQVISSSAGDVQPVFQAMLENAVRICDATFGNIYRWDGENLHLVAANKSPSSFVQTRARIGLHPGANDPVGRMIMTKAVVHTADLAAERDYIERRNPGIVAAVEVGGVRTLLAVPLLKDNQLIGSFHLSRQEVRPFTEKQIALVTSFASQAVIAIENTRLLNELRQRTADLSESLEQQTATSEVLGVISRSKFELQPILQSVVNTAMRLCRAEQSVIYRQEEGTYRFAAGHSTVPDYLDIERGTVILPGKGTVVGRAALTRQVARIDDAWNDPLYEKKRDAKIGGVRSMIGVPLLREAEPIGAIALARNRVEPFTDREIELVTTFADQAVIAIENVRLFDEVQARTRDLSESLQQQTATADVLKVISRSAFDLKTVLDTLVEAAARLCEADQGTIARDRDGVFQRVATYGFSDEFTEYVKTIPVIPERGTATGRALLDGKVVHIADVQADPEYTFAEAQKLGGFRTILSLPMLREGVPIGVLALTRREVRPFTDKQIELVSTFADQAAIAIENVRLFESVEARTRELAKSLEDLRTAQDRLVQTQKLASLGQLTAGIAHEIKNPLNFVNNFSAASVELIDELREALGGAHLNSKLGAEISEIADTLQGNLDKVVQHGKRADAIVKNMLLHSRQGSGEHRPVDINALVDESLNLAYHGARAEKQGFNITLAKSFDPAAGEVDLFPQEITRALLNLISNGFYAATKRKAEANGGDYEPTLTATTKNLGNSVEIRIRDNGTGIPPEVREKLFNPFFTTKPAGEGTSSSSSMPGLLRSIRSPGVSPNFGSFCRERLRLSLAVERDLKA
jgi:two-component system, NtrC family, sensor kinase